MAANPERFAESIEAGKTIQQSMLDAGYSRNTAKQGLAGVSDRVLKALSRDGKRLLKMWDQFTLEERGRIAMVRLTMNAIAGKDGGVMSCKQIGSHKDLALWQPDSQVGVVVLNAPNQLMQKKAELVEAEEVKE